MVKRQITLLFLLNLLICGGLLVHYVSEARCGVEVCVSAEIHTEETSLHGGIDFPTLPNALSPFTVILFVSLLYLSTWRYTRPPLHEPPRFA